MKSFKLLALSLALSIVITPLTTFAQTTVNAINLTIPKVRVTGQDALTERVAENAWSYDGELTLDDQIKYGWAAVSLDIGCKVTPQSRCGFIQVFKDTVSEDTLILETGSSPLPVSKLGSELVEGSNKIILVYIDSNNQTDTSTQVSFDFSFKNETTNPSIEVVSPAPQSLFAKGINQDFTLRLSNFQLESVESGDKNRGKLNIYHTVATPENLLGTWSSSITDTSGETTVRFNSRDFEFQKIPDSVSSQLIFQLTDVEGNILPFSTDFPIKTNYGGTIDAGVPSVTIVEPKKDRSDLSVDGKLRFIVEVNNFEIQDELQSGPNSLVEGYLQIFIDDAPIQNLWPKTDFTLEEIGAANLGEGRKTIRVQLVNLDYTKLTPEAEDTIDIIYTPSVVNQEEGSEETSLQSNTWRIIVVILTIILVIGGIAVLITKG